MPLQTAQTSTSESTDIVKLAVINLIPVMHGAIAGPAIEAGSLWENAPVAILVIRRPGCPLCRLDARDLSSLFASEFRNIRLIGIIKQIAPIPGAATDDDLGVETFQTKFFGGNQLFLDTERKFYEFFGNKNVLNQPLRSYNPCTLYSDTSHLLHRLEQHKIDDYNWIGEAYVQGGFLVVDPNGGVIFKHEEQTGWSMPVEDISQILMKLSYKYTLNP